MTVETCARFQILSDSRSSFVAWHASHVFAEVGACARGQIPKDHKVSLPIEVNGSEVET